MPSKRPARQPKERQRTKRDAARADAARLAARIKSECGCSYRDIADAIGIHHRVVENMFCVGERPHHLRFADVLMLGREPATAEFSRRLLLAALATLDPHQLRAVDLQRMAASPMPADREIVVNVLRPLAEQLGLVPSIVMNTAEVAT